MGFGLGGVREVIWTEKVRDWGMLGKGFGLRR